MNLFKLLFSRNKERQRAAGAAKDFADRAAEFSDKYPESLVILGDPSSDMIFMAHKGIIAPIRILNRDGSRNYIVSNALKHDRGQADIDRFLLAVDGGLFSIANAIYTARKESMKGKMLDWVGGNQAAPAESAVTLADGSRLSMIQVVDKS